MEHSKHIESLFKKHKEGSASVEETRVLLAFFKDPQNSDYLNALIDQEFEEDATEMAEELVSSIARSVKSVVDLHIEGHTTERPVLFRYIRSYKYGWWSAAILILGLFGLYQYNLYPVKVGHPIAFTDTKDQEKATLTLGNGQQIELDTDKDGIITRNEGLTYADGQNLVQLHEVQQALLSTPRKTQYSTMLPDGTQVWLNAESSLSYPTSFEGAERIVELKGEGYFEVAHDAKHPFIVVTKGQRLKVLGTSFNLKAYTNEPAVVTTLVTGRVQLYSDKATVAQMLSPGQQSAFVEDKFYVGHVDTKIFCAWKLGELRFRATPLDEVLREIERWYDIDIDYSTVPKGVKIHASIRKDKKLAIVIEALEKITELKFDIQGRRLKIMH
ncbi:FecR family protein [Sphingobacterium tabacisoli]|uniref:FecR family protein n=1 Tax=Sphingobacterium tabacisoli TaxID=2044855 RepID=A0ABW5L7K2_9SPHI|nr:FecR family protein [Sphingobacterium tabacisoli]